MLSRIVNFLLGVEEQESIDIIIKTIKSGQVCDTHKVEKVKRIAAGNIVTYTFKGLEGSLIKAVINHKDNYYTIRDEYSLILSTSSFDNFLSRLGCPIY